MDGNSGVDGFARRKLIIATAGPRPLPGTLAGLLKGQDLSVVDEGCHNFQQLRALVDRHRPDAVVVRLPLGGLDDVAELLDLRQSRPELGIVVIAPANGPLAGLVPMLDRAGVAIVTPTARGAEFPEIVSLVCHGYAVLAPEVTRALAPWTRRQPARVPNPLRPRELGVLERLAHGVPEAEIAQDLGISLRSVQQAIADARSKLGAADRGHAVAIALNSGLIKGPEVGH